MGLNWIVHIYTRTMSFSPVLTNVLKVNRRQVFRAFHLRPVLLYESRRLVDSVTIHTSAYAEGVTRNNVSPAERRYLT